MSVFSKIIKNFSLPAIIALLPLSNMAGNYIDKNELKSQVDAHVQNTKQWFYNNGFDCGVDNSNYWCAVETVYFDDGAFEQQRTDTKQTIMVLDSGLDFPAIIRYRSRIKAIYRYDAGTKSFVYDNPRTTISRAGKKVLGELDRFQYYRNGNPEPAFVPAAWLGEIASVYTSKVPNDHTDYETGLAHSTHGSTVINYLLEHNPKAEFVLVDTESFTPFRQHKELFCNKDYQGFENIMWTAAYYLRNIIAHEGVEYVNYSGGFTKESAYRDWNMNDCAGDLWEYGAGKMVSALFPIYDALFNQGNTLGIQAGVRYGADLDTEYFWHRLRVASFTSESDDIALSEDGAHYWRDAFDDYNWLFNGHESIDLFVNFGFKDFSFNPADQNSTPKMTSDVFGMRYRADWDLHSSWAAPLATSVAIYINNSEGGGNMMPREIMDKLVPWKDECKVKWYDNWNSERKAFAESGQGRCRIQDPLKFRRLELHRLGYLD